jgi:hypothetical protein
MKDLVINYEDGNVGFTAHMVWQQQQMEWLPESTSVPPGVTLMTLEQAEAELLHRRRQHTQQQQQQRAGTRGPGNNQSAVAGAAVSLPADFAAVAATTSVAYTATRSLCFNGTAH